MAETLGPRRVADIEAVQVAAALKPIWGHRDGKQDTRAAGNRLQFRHSAGVAAAWQDGSLCAVIFRWGIFSKAHGGYRLHFEQTHASLNFSAYEPDALDFSIAPQQDPLNFDERS